MLGIGRFAGDHEENSANLLANAPARPSPGGGGSARREPIPEKFEAGPSEEKGPPRESRRGEGGGGGSPPFFGCDQTVSACRVDPLNSYHDSVTKNGPYAALPRSLTWPIVLIGGPSFWFCELGGTPVRRPALPGPLDCDVAIVGAGYTGLWTAYYLKRADPGLRVVVLEREFAGYGASGRNGGWVAGAVAGVHDDATVRGHHRDGRRGRAGVPRPRASRARSTRAARSPCHRPDAARAAARPSARRTACGSSPPSWPSGCASPARWARCSIPNVARVQPAELVRGLADAVERLGVPIYEGTAVTAIEPRVARTAQGDVRATWVVRATEGYTPSLPGLARQIIPLRLDDRRHRAAPGRIWDEIGWAERRDDRRRGALVRLHPAHGRRPHRDRRPRPAVLLALRRRPLRRGRELGRPAPHREAARAVAGHARRRDRARLVGRVRCASRLDAGGLRRPRDRPRVRPAAGSARASPPPTWAGGSWPT